MDIYTSKHTGLFTNRMDRSAGWKNLMHTIVNESALDDDFFGFVSDADLKSINTKERKVADLRKFIRPFP